MFIWSYYEYDRGGWKVSYQRNFPPELHDLEYTDLYISLIQNMWKRNYFLRITEVIKIGILSSII